MLTGAGLENVTVSFGQFYEDSGRISIPESFGMFSKAGNNILILRARKLVERMEAAPKAWRDTFLLYFKEYTRLSNKYDHKSAHGEMSDTAVREAVCDFALRLGKEYDLAYDNLDGVWNLRHD